MTSRTKAPTAAWTVTLAVVLLITNIALVSARIFYGIRPPIWLLVVLLAVNVLTVSWAYKGLRTTNPGS